MSDMHICYVGEETKCLTLMWAVIWGFTNLQCISIVERVGFCGFAMPADFENQQWDWIQNFINTLTYVCCNNINQEIMQNQVKSSK